MTAAARAFAAVGPLRPLRLPPHAAGMRIGLFGGSFNPPHHGHRLVAEMAIRALGLDALWWMVTPGNPLKTTSNLAPLGERIAACEALARHPRIVVTAFEARLGVRYTVDMLGYLRRRCDGVEFIWIMGADSLAGFHRWKDWRRIAHLAPLAVIDRPGATLKASAGRAGQVLARYRRDQGAARVLAGRPPPAWVFLYGPRSPLSSTALRRAAGRGA